jgi:hypothetical protein
VTDIGSMCVENRNQVVGPGAPGSLCNVPVRTCPCAKDEPGLSWVLDE